MDSAGTLLERARISLKLAEHVLIRTYPLVEDPKLILAVAEDIQAALSSAAEAVLVHAGKYRQGREMAKCLEDLHVLGAMTDEERALFQRMHRIVEGHKESPVEFPRKDNFVICDKDYVCDVVSIDDMKKYLFRAGLFVEKAGHTVRGSRKDE